MRIPVRTRRVVSCNDGRRLSLLRHENCFRRGRVAMTACAALPTPGIVGCWPTTWSVMRSATASTPSMSSDSPLTGPRPSVAPAYTPTPMVTRPPSSRCTAAMESTAKWIAVRLHALTRLLQMSEWPATGHCDKCCTTTSLGQPRKRYPATTSPPMMCLTASASHTGHGTDSKCRPLAWELGFWRVPVRAPAKLSPPYACDQGALLRCPPRPHCTSASGGIGVTASLLHSDVT